MYISQDIEGEKTKEKMMCIFIVSMFLLTSITVVSAIKLDTETKVVNSQTSNYDDYVLVETWHPPYQDELDDSGVTGWIHANKNTGKLEGFAMAQADTPFSNGFGWIACKYKHDCSYTSIEKIDFVFSEFYAHIGGNLLWTKGSASISIKYELYRRGNKEKTGTIWEKSADAFPNYYFLEDDPFTKTVYPHVDLGTNEHSPDNVEIRVTGSVYCSADEGYASCEFDLLLSSIKIYANKPDLTVTDVWTVPSEFRPGADVTIKATIKNIGGSKADREHPTEYSFLTGFYLDGEDIGNRGTFSLDPDETKTVDVPVPHGWPYDFSSHTIKVKVDVELWYNGRYQDMIDESNENNNEKTLSKAAPKDKYINLGYVPTNIFQRLKLLSLPIQFSIN